MTFEVRLGNDDWLDELSGWHCDAARVATVVELDVQGRRIVPDVVGDIIRLTPLPDPRPRSVIVLLELPHERFSSEKRLYRRWKLLFTFATALVPIVCAVIVGYYSQKVEAMRAANQIDLKRLEERNQRVANDEHACQDARQKCLNQVNSICGGQGQANVNCHGTFNIGSNR